MTFIKGGVTAPSGFSAGAVNCGIKYKKRNDLALIVSDSLATCAGVFTQNRIKAAPVLITQDHVKDGNARAIIVNSGNANACTGENGIETAIAMAAQTAKLIKCDPSEVLVSSTGVIGHRFPIEKVERKLPKIISDITNRGSARAAKAIMTTDTVPKQTAVEFELDGRTVRIGAIAKGSGMICPNMATMLSFITTDAEIEKSALRKSLRESVDSTFNCITVDGDMSPNDMVLILANGRAGNSVINSRTKAFEHFKEALTAICMQMAQAIVRDGEGATKFITVRVTGAGAKEEARQVGLAIANSPLVKTAFFGEDPNWGRIICAAGYSGISVDESNITISINGAAIFENGKTSSFNEEKLRKEMSSRDLILDVDLGMGKAEKTIYTTDMSYDYIKINAEYTT